MRDIIVEQLYVMLRFGITGLIMGIIFDLFRIRRRVFLLKDYFTYIEDILYWVITGLLLIYTIVKYTNR